LQLAVGIRRVHAIYDFATKHESCPYLPKDAQKAYVQKQMRPWTNPSTDAFAFARLSVRDTKLTQKRLEISRHKSS